MKHIYIDNKAIQKWIESNRPEATPSFKDFGGEIEVAFEYRVEGYWDQLIEEKTRFFEGGVQITDVYSINDLPVEAYEKWFSDACIEITSDIANEDIYEYLED